MKRIPRTEFEPVINEIEDILQCKERRIPSPVIRILFMQPDGRFDVRDVLDGWENGISVERFDSLKAYLVGLRQ